MRSARLRGFMAVGAALAAASAGLITAAAGAVPPLAEIPANTWVKLSPLEGTPTSPRLGYEGACAWDSRHRRLVRYGGHNQGGGGEQGSEVWTFDPTNARWELHEPDTSPPGICCGQQNLYDPVLGRYLRFPSFSGSHGWQWFREIYLNDSPVWSYDLASNRWRNRRPLPAPTPRPLRCVSWDSDHGVAVVFGGEGSHDGTWVYDPFTNTWTERNPPEEPPARSAGNMAYDRAARRHVLFGAQFQDDPHTWAYDLPADRWEKLPCAVQPPTDRNDAVLCYDPRARRVLAVVKVTRGEGENATHRLETWSLETAAARWTKVNPPKEPDPSGNRARQLVYAPELGVALLENCTRPAKGQPREQQVWAFRLAAEEPGAGNGEAHPPPGDLKVVTREGGAVYLTWSAAGLPAGAQVEIHRGFAPSGRPWEAEEELLATVTADAQEHLDAGPDRRIPQYRLRTVAGGRTSPLTAPVRAQPGVVEDLVASVGADGSVELTWDPPPAGADDIMGYVVWLAPVEIYSEDQLRRLKDVCPPLDPPSAGAIRKIGLFKPWHLGRTRSPYKGAPFIVGTPGPVEGDPTFERRFHPDQFDPDGKAYSRPVYAYRVRAYNHLGVSSFSVPVLSLPSAPRQVFAREDGETCHLRWEPNPEKGVVGYRVYRMDGRWNKDPVTRLTPDPIAATTFSDPGAGKSTRRYYVVAVDALGQEGHPSAPVWFKREWRRFYAPFAGDWHQ